MNPAGLLLILTTLSAPPDTTGPVQPTHPAVEMETAVSRDHLSGGRPPWRELLVRGTLLRQPRGGWFAQARVVERFERADAEARLGAALPLRSAATLELEASLAPGAEIVPRTSVGAHLQRAVGGGWTVGGGFRMDRYDEHSVATGNGLVEWYFGASRLAWRVSMAVLDGEAAPAGTLTASRYFAAGGQVNLAASLGREVERADALELLVTRTGGVSAWGVLPLNHRLALTAATGFHRHEALYDRVHGRIGLRVRY